MRFSAAELAECAEREVRFRERVYPKRVAENRMTEGLASRQLAMMRAIAARLRAEADREASAGRLL